MSEVVGLDNLALVSDGPTLSMSISKGSIVGVYGPARSGKSEFLNIVRGEVRPPIGKVNLRTSVAAAETIASRRGVRPLALARSGKSPESSSKATEVLLATNLWDVKSTPLTQLSAGQQAASELLQPLTSDAALLLFDGQLDLVDPWTLRSVMAHLRKLRSRGVAIIIATNKLDLLYHFDAIVLLQSRVLRFAGDCDELARLHGANEFVVTANNQAGVLAIVSPFSISVEERDQELRFRAAEGQEIAAKLLLEGYGNVSLVVQRQRSLEECLLSLLR